MKQLFIILFVLLCLPVIALAQDSADTKQTTDCLPEHLQKERHTDWPWPFRYVPRRWTAFCGQGPVVHGWKDPVPLPGTKRWHWKDKNGKWRPFLAKTWGRYSPGKSNWTFRIGFRWDSIDKYYNLVIPFTFKKMRFE